MPLKCSQRSRPAEPALYARDGSRKYLNEAERLRFLAAARASPAQVMTLCLTLAHTGCRISEALELTAASVQPDAATLSIRTLKKRGTIAIREVPVPDELIATLEREHGVSTAQRDMDRARHARLWPYGRTWGWMQVKAVMARSLVTGRQASPKGLRHGFGVHAVQCGVPLHLVQRWLGHARLSTTAIYADVVGPEERALAQRMW